ncbi:MAG: WXG100 family type VII secretion target [Oscillospiraceae bacterium]|nr:WXG100 family type VII secretion target [Oscillospiraceae bacterium]
MADVIHVSTEQLRSTVGKYNTQKAQLQMQYLQMSNAVRQLDASYNGDASEAFKAQFDQLYKNIEQTEGKVQDAVDEMTKAAEIYDQVEADRQTAFQNLSTGTNPYM